ncbi:cupin domain-containing protein [Massilia endophytica]|uniref:hypothetical protein n=1 Tax=Massilia endophytica TaxID=2899220 RepID=UPI001E33788C|nr:hypothetical protein [Massilia endophytica]UGQ46955.1 hypothetical protein LSQ66_00260 [Massilia endophytica]
MKRFVLASAVLFYFAHPAGALENSATSSWDGKAIAYPQGQAEVGDKAVKLFVVYTGAAGGTLTIAHPEFKAAARQE